MSDSFYPTLNGTMPCTTVAWSNRCDSDMMKQKVVFLLFSPMPCSDTCWCLSVALFPHIKWSFIWLMWTQQLSDNLKLAWITNTKIENGDVCLVHSLCVSYQNRPTAPWLHWFWYWTGHTVWIQSQTLWHPVEQHAGQNFQIEKQIKYYFW